MLVLLMYFFTSSKKYNRESQSRLLYMIKYNKDYIH